MPPRSALVANSLELALAFAGMIVLWRVVLSPAARARSTAHPPAVTAWDAPLSDFLLFLWTIVCGGVLAQLLVAMLFKPLALSEDARLILANAALELGMLGGIAFYWLSLRHGAPRRAFAPFQAVRTGLTTFLIAMPVVLLVGLVWQFLLESCGLPVEPQDIIARFVKLESPALLAGMIVLATITAPIAEEMIFRAGFFRYLRTRLPRWAALLAPACLFAALHQSLAMFAPLVALGIVFSLAYERTGRIGTAMVAHGLFNAHTIALLLIDPSSAK